MQNALSKLIELLHSFVKQSVENMCAKFIVDSLSCFCTGARQVFTTQKPFPNEIPINMITATSISL